jgi:hypothetical protein
METKIIEAMDSPKELETLYRENPDEFLHAFPSVFANHPESTILQVWQERLNYETEKKKEQAIPTWSFKDILVIVIWIAIAGTILKLPGFINSIDTSWFYKRELVLVLIVPVTAYFVQRARPVRLAVVVSLIAIGALIYVNLLPHLYYAEQSAVGLKAFCDALTNAEIHIQLFLWLLTGVAFSGKDWNKASARMGFLRYNGELIIYMTILLIGSLILYFMTLSLIGFIDSFQLEIWYENVAFYIAASIPIIATFILDKVVDKRINIAPTIAKVFTPLFLITTLAYFAIMIAYQKNPFGDRESLIVLNALLIIVLGLLIFTIAERNVFSPPSFNDYLNIGLAFTTIILDAIALSASLFRSTSDIFGLTPNRIVILGMNLLVFIHLSGILVNYARFIWGGKPFEKLENWIAGYLPCYAIWAVVVSIMLPVLFWYK